MSCRYAVGNDRCQYESYTHSKLQFDRYLREKKTNPTLTLGEHMKKIGRHF